MGCCCGPRGWGISGLVVAIIGAVMAATLNLIVDTIIDQQLVLEDGTIMHSFWTESPVPMHMRLYLYNVTNSEDVYKNGAKPIVVQLGPYTYEEKHIRVRVQNFKNNTVQFQQKRIWNFVPEMSNGSLSDPVTTVNPIVVSAAFVIRDAGPLIKGPFNAALKALNSSYFITKTADEYFFKGFDDPLLAFTDLLPPGLLNLPPYDKFGWFYTRNESEFYDGVFNVFTGADDINKLMVMDLWNGTQQTTYYESHCGMVNGSFGEGWPPYQSRTNITMYSTDLCRSITLDYEKDVEDSGITFYRYVGSKRMFANATDNPDNWCFCPKGECKPSGVVDSSVCRYGSPAFVSFPHFYNADPFYLEQVEGQNPQEDLHQFHIDMEPRTSVPLKVSARFQINLLIEAINGIEITKGIRRTFLPVTWFEVIADLKTKPDLLWWVNFTLDAPLIGVICFFCTFIVGIIVVAVSGVKYAKNKKAKRTRKLTAGNVNSDPVIIAQ